MELDWDKQHFHAVSESRGYSKEIVSEAFAIDPDRIDEFHQRFPDIPVDNDGCPHFTNFKQHENYLKETGTRKEIKRNGNKPTRRFRIDKKSGNLVHTNLPR